MRYRATIKFNKRGTMSIKIPATIEMSGVTCATVGASSTPLVQLPYDDPSLRVVRPEWQLRVDGGHCALARMKKLNRCFERRRSRFPRNGLGDNLIKMIAIGAGECAYLKSNQRRLDVYQHHRT